MPKYKDQSLAKYLDQLACREPVPGGGSAAALTACLGVALISMVAQYSKGKNKAKSADARIRAILKESEKIRKRLLVLVDSDAQAYLKVVKARKGHAKAKQAALRQAQKVPMEVCRLCYKALDLAPFLVKEGNRYLIGDIQVAGELLLAAFSSARINVEINQ